MQATNELTFLSLNVRGLSNNRKRAAVFAWCKRQGADIVFLQETHSTKSSEKTWEKCWGNTIYFSHGKSNARGTCILIKPSLKIDVEKQTTDSNGRLIILKLCVNNTSYSLVNVYAPNNPGKSADLFDKMSSIMSIENIDVSSNIVMGGDFNTCFDPSLDRYGYHLGYDKKNLHVEHLENLMENYALQDIWRIKILR